MRSRFMALKGKARDYKLYVRFDPTLNGNGGGGTGNGGADSGAIATAGGHTLLVGSDPVTADQRGQSRLRRAGATPRSTPTRASAQVTNGFAGAASDGLTQLDAAHAADQPLRRGEHRQPRADRARSTSAHDGDFDARARLRRVTPASAVGAARGTPQGALRRPQPRLRRAAGTATTTALIAPRRPNGVSRDRWSELRRRVLPERQLREGRRGQDVPRRRRRGAGLAVGPGRVRPATPPTPTSAPTARCSPATSTRRGRRCFLAGDRARRARMTRFLFERQQLPDGSMPRNSLTNGKPAPDSLQHPARRVRLPAGDGARRRAHRARRTTRTTSSRPRTSSPRHGPSFGPERWEEQSGFSPSTISAEIAGLLGGGEDRRPQRRRRLGARVARRRPTSSSATSRAGR